MDARSVAAEVSGESAPTVLVVGDGPAALAAAIELRTSGIGVRLAGRARGGAPRPGESLAPQARRLLQRLGVWDGFVRDEHLPCHANRSHWGPGPARHVDFLSHPMGHAFHVDRERFDARLRERARALGVRDDLDPALLRIERASSRWRCAQVHAHAEAHADDHFDAHFVVDASGRASWFARRHGAVRLHEDRQVALLAWGDGAAWPGDTMCMVESTELGWWYSAPTPRGHWAVAFFTDADLQHRAWRTGLGWVDLLDRSQATRRRLAAQGFVPRGSATVVAADSARLDRFTGDGWLAVGDAAMSYDPLSSHGLTVALQSGIDGAAAIAAHLRDGDTLATAAYGQRLDQAHQAYAHERAALYRSETRFAGHPYWRRRHALEGTGQSPWPR